MIPALAARVSRQPRRKPLAVLGPATIDWSHPLSAGLKGFWLLREPGVVASLVDGRRMTLGTSTAAPTFGSDVEGPRYSFDGGDTMRLDTAVHNLPATGAPLTLMGRATVRNAAPPGDAYSIVALGLEATEAFAGLVYGYSGNYWEYRLKRAAADTTANAEGAGATVNQYYTVAGVTYGNADHRLFVDGAQAGTSTQALSAGATTWDRTTLGYERSGTFDHHAIDGTIQWAAIWSRALSASEVLRMHLDPYALLMPAAGRTTLNGRARARHYASVATFPPTPFEREAAQGVERSPITSR
ncbi:MAG: LamG-like jellyroll fold domain-containing protein [Terriglobales bacterium]